MIASMNAVDVALLESEWASDDGRCPSCHAAGSRGDSFASHEPGCAHDQALSERGYPTQADRNAARARIEEVERVTVPPGT